MRKFGIQKFLNSVDSPDSGWVKFSVIKSRKTLGRVTTRTIIADCSQQIELEFDLYGIDTERLSPSKIEEKIIESFAHIKERRKKVETFRGAVNRYCDALLVAYKEAESELVKQLDELE